ncbi:MAG: glutamate-5-semialdehyde dehydrogenase [Clostridiales bacterium]|nr:glutamate-5-semialdehyde dehydrogenase [Clostridiales bacterium]
MTTQEILIKANAVKTQAALLSEKQKNDALNLMAQSLENSIDAILYANEQDVLAAKGIISEVMIDRLALNKERIIAMANGVRALINLPDPIGKVLSSYTRADGLVINKVSVPMGVVAIIYESRPNVTSDAAALALKSGNVCVLRTGKEAYNSAKAIVTAMKNGLKQAGLSQDLVNLVDDVTRQSSYDLMTAVGFVDLLIPRGGAGLIKACVENAKVNCIQTGTGICHIYVDEFADLNMALKIIENAKCSRPSVCNALESLVVHKSISQEFLPMLYKTLVLNRSSNPVQLRLDSSSWDILGGQLGCVKACEKDFDTEFLDYILAVTVVDDINEAISHISKHSTQHSECIITTSEKNASLFTRSVDSSSVYVNASTRFTDGGEFGLGCEMGISTQKLHARGPMGLSELTCYKYVIQGNGNIR